MRRIPRAWVGRAAVAVLLAAFTNAALVAVAVDHDPFLVTLLVVAVVATGGLAVGFLETETRPAWTVRRSDARADPGEDTRTAMYRHLIEVHLSSKEADDAIVWQVADLARSRMRQVHGLRFEDSPERATELLGPVLADWVSRDRRRRYVPGARHRRYTVGQLGDAVRRIEEL